MATTPNITQITAPRVPLIDPRTGLMSREWYRFFYNQYVITGNGTGVTPVASGGTGLSAIPTNGQLLIGNGSGYTLNTLGAGVGITVTNGAGTIVVANSGVLSYSAGTTGLTPSTATTGNVVLGGTLIAANGGTGFASYAVGDLVYADTTTTFAKLSIGTTGQVLSVTAGVPTWTTPASGTVTSVTATAPVVSSGGAAPVISLAASYGDTQNPYASKTANYFLAAPNGSAGVPTFRAIVAADIPTLNQNTSGTASNVTGTVAIANGGTGQTTASAAFNALSPITTTGDLIIGNGTNSATRLPIGTNGYVLTSNGTTATWSVSAGGVTSFSAGTTGLTPSTATTGAVTLAGTLAVANGGTGVTTSTGSGNTVLSTSPTLTTPTINQLTSAAATSLVLQSAGTTALTLDTSQNATFAGSVKPLSTSGIIGTTTNDNANAGSVGEYVSSSVTGVSLNTTAANATSISLTAGDWDARIVLSSGGASATCTAVLIAINTISGDVGTQSVDNLWVAADVVNGLVGGAFTKRISLSSTTTVYAIARTAGGTCTFTAVTLSARRIR